MTSQLLLSAKETSVAVKSPDAADHRRVLPSSLADMSQLLSGLKVRPLIASVCALKVRAGVALVKSQRPRRPRRSPATKRLPSGLNATDEKPSEPVNDCNSRPLAASHSFTVLS